MMKTKLKNLVKIACYATAFVIFCYLEGKYELITGKSGESEMSGAKILSSNFEVFGRVQGVFFRVNTEQAAKRLGVRGWCMNTKEGTVKGVIEGEEKPFNEMKHWLSEIGSPQSKIERTVFSEATVISDYTFPDFGVRRFPKKK